MCVFFRPIPFQSLVKKQETGFGGFGFFSSGGFGSSQQRLLDKLEHWHEQESTSMKLVTQLCSDGKLVFLSGTRRESEGEERPSSLTIGDDASVPASTRGCIDIVQLLDGGGGVLHRIPLPFAPVSAALNIPGDPSGGWILAAGDGNIYSLQGANELHPEHATTEKTLKTPLSLLRLSREGAVAVCDDSSAPVGTSTVTLKPFDGFRSGFSKGAPATKASSDLGGVPISPVLAGEYFRTLKSEGEMQRAAAEVIAFLRPERAKCTHTENKEQSTALKRAHHRVAAALPQSHRVIMVESASSSSGGAEAPESTMQVVDTTSNTIREISVQASVHRDARRELSEKQKTALQSYRGVIAVTELCGNVATLSVESPISACVGFEKEEEGDGRGEESGERESAR